MKNIVKKYPVSIIFKSLKLDIFALCKVLKNQQRLKKGCMEFKRYNTSKHKIILIIEKGGKGKCEIKTYKKRYTVIKIFK